MGKNNKYILLVDENESSYGVCRWTLSLTKDDLNKIRCLKEASEKYYENPKSEENDLPIGLDVTDIFAPEHEPTYEGMEIIGSKLLYIGYDEFIVRCDFVDDWDAPSYIITERFKIDL